MESKDFNAGLQRHLMKCELEYRAKVLPEGSNVDWLAVYCDSVTEIAAFLRELGFKIREIVDEEPWPGEYHRWVKTTGGIIVYANTPYSRGLIARSGKN